MAGNGKIFLKLHVLAYGPLTAQTADTRHWHVIALLNWCGKCVSKQLPLHILADTEQHDDPIGVMFVSPDECKASIPSPFSSGLVSTNWGGGVQVALPEKSCSWKHWDCTRKEMCRKTKTRSRKRLKRSLELRGVLSLVKLVCGCVTVSDSFHITHGLLIHF